ncbi:asparagine synthetase asnB [Mycobacterium tuberculosis GM 1503]|nr:asparagine synthetase asnB [Mycobacterium tuberculosis GM 1503]
MFGFNRLSIIDIAHSHQPLRWGPPEAPDRYVLVFNGEIYNYLELRDELRTQHGAVFATDGDGEAILAGYHHWGTEVLQRLRGMFAFALWDTVTRELFCARDPFGIKPLFIATGAGGTAVASEKKCLLDLVELVGFDTEIDHRALQHYTVLQYVPEPETLHRGVRRLESGCFARIRADQLAPVITRYFVPRFAASPITNDNDQARYDEITAVLEDSVAKHMRADVTVGAFLSGGIDSTAIAALAIRHNPRLITFTTGFEREGFSEIDVAVASAEAIGARHIAKVVSADEFVAALPEIVWYLDEPVADPALVPLFFVAREARKHVKVVLSGEGADELFGGYTIYREPLSLRPFDYLPKPLRRSMGKVSKPLPEGMRGKSLLHRGSLTLEERYYGNARSFLRRAAARSTARVPAGLDPHRCHGAGLRRIGRLGSGGANAAHRPVHLAARRHSGQGRQDNDGQLPGAAGAVPGPGGFRGGLPVAGGRQDHPYHHQVRAAARAGAYCARTRAAPAQARVPGPDPALAACRRAAGVGVCDGGLVAGRSLG